MATFMLPYLAKFRKSVAEFSYIRLALTLCKTRREPLTRMMKDIDDLETKDVKFMTEARYNVGYFAWWTSILCTLTT